MNKRQRLQLIIGVVIFLIITSLTYYIMSPAPATNTTANITTNTTSDLSPLTNVYRILTSITAGGVVGIVTVFLLFSTGRH